MTDSRHLLAYLILIAMAAALAFAIRRARRSTSHLRQHNRIDTGSH